MSVPLLGGSHAQLRPKTATVGRTKPRPPPAGRKRLLVAFIVMVGANVLAGVAPNWAFPKSNADLSGVNPTYITPDGGTFAVWGVIYLLEFAAIVKEVMCDRSMILYPKLRALQSLSLAFVLNGLWLILFAWEFYGTQFVVMVAYLLSLLCCYVDLDPLQTEGLVIMQAAVAVNLAWVCVATLLSAFIAMARLSRGVGISPDLPLKEPAGTPELAVSAAIILTVLAFVLLATRRDLPFAATVAWALAGVGRMQASRRDAEPLVALVCGRCATACSVGCGCLLLWQCCCRQRRRRLSPL